MWVLKKPAKSHAKRNIPKTPLLAFVSTFNPNNNSIYLTIKKFIKNLQNSKTMKDFFKN